MTVEAIATKLRRHAERYCFWEPLFVFSLEICAQTLLMAARAEDEALAAGVRPDQIKGLDEIRQTARDTLEAWRVILDGSVHLVPLDSLGRDTELRRFLEG
jgi:hypothetical protein